MDGTEVPAGGIPRPAQFLRSGRKAQACCERIRERWTRQWGVQDDVRSTQIGAIIRASADGCRGPSLGELSSARPARGVLLSSGRWSPTQLVVLGGLDCIGRAVKGALSLLQGIDGITIP